MDPFFLTFHDFALERSYQEYLAKQCKRKHTWPWTLVRLFGCKSIFTAVMQHETSWPHVTMFLYVLLIASPTLQYFFQRRVDDEWYIKQGLTLKFLHGLFQVFINIMITRNNLPAIQEQGSSTVLELMVASGMLSQCFTMFWVGSHFTFFIFSSLYSSLLFHNLVIFPLCEADTINGKSNEPGGFFLMLRTILDNALVMAKPEWTADTQTCSRVLSWWNIYFGVLFLSCLVWVLGRYSRRAFLSRVSRQQYEIPEIRPLGIQSIMPLLLLLPLSWQMVDLFHVFFPSTSTHLL